MSGLHVSTVRRDSRAAISIGIAAGESYYRNRSAVKSAFGRARRLRAALRRGRAHDHGEHTIMESTRFIPLIALALLLSACTGGGPTESPAGDANGQAPTEAPAAEEPQDDAGDGGADGPVAASVELTITGGEFAGSYAGSVPDGGCSRGATGENTFGLQYSTVDEDVDFSSVQLVVNDAAAAAAGTDNFFATIQMGPLLTGDPNMVLTIDPGGEQGTGTATVDDRGDSATITIQGETADGVGIQANVTCNSVFDFADLGG
jgi:hypothetical protein